MSPQVTQNIESIVRNNPPSKSFSTHTVQIADIAYSTKLNVRDINKTFAPLLESFDALPKKKKAVYSPNTNKHEHVPTRPATKNSRTNRAPKPNLLRVPGHPP